MTRIEIASQADMAAHKNLIVMARGKGELELGGCEVDASDRARFEQVRKLGDFSGKRGATALIYGEAGRRWLLAGLGDAGKVDGASWRDAAAAAQKALAALDAAEAALIVPTGADIGEISAALILSGYKYDYYMSSDDAKGKHLKTVTLLLPAGADAAAAAAEAKRAGIVAGGTLLARDLLCAPANRATPSFLAEAGIAIAKASGGKVSCKVLGEAELAADHFDALLAVGRGSVEESKLIVLDYDGGGDKTVVLVGKGVTFDTGGISIKPAAAMDEMKYDMGGAAAVLGTFSVLAGLGLPLRIVGIVPTVENMPGSNAYRPGDILRTRSGLTVEVKNTDAEGRLILADALDYAKSFEPDLLIDLATLTGACVVALAHEAAGMMANEGGAAYQAAMSASGERTGERVWPLPMYEEYGELIKSEFADIKNTGGRHGGAITAGKFLQRFADHSSWIHLDIAGAAWWETERGMVPKVGNGFGVRLLADFLGHLAAGK